jgi:3-phenylpropionate/trans-cinnamate dioxygenase ferredoxin reductase subunit
MMANQYGCIVVGGGLAGANVVTGLRDGGFSESIMLIGDEPDLPYERPALSKDYLLGKAERGSLFVHPDDWYAANEVEVVLDDGVTSIDRTTKTVTLESGLRPSYDRLVLATGSSPRTLSIEGADLAGVHTLRRIGDSETLRTAFERQLRLVVIGAGWIGLEVAAAARSKGCEVTVLEAAEVPLSAVLGTEVGSHFAALHRGNGVDLRAGVSVAGILGSNGKVAAVRVGDELVDADLVVMGVGARPNTELAVACGLPADGGVTVDARLRTVDTSVLAVGDVATAFNPALGRPVRVEHWDNAIRQGQLAAASILGRDDEFDWQPYFYTDQYDLGMEYVGLGSPDDQIVVRGDIDSGECIVFWVRDEAVSAAMNVNVWDVNDMLRGLIGRQIARDRLRDASLPLEEL